MTLDATKLDSKESPWQLLEVTILLHASKPHNQEVHVS
jgi:hypothetical protein